MRRSKKRERPGVRVVVDTNVWVSAVLTPHSFAAQWCARKNPKFEPESARKLVN